MLPHRNIQTGRYSIALAKEGFEVDAVELTDHNLYIMNSKLEGMHNIRTYQGNALDLSLFRDESFDITLVLGPMYHLMLMQLSTLIRVEVS